MSGYLERIREMERQRRLSPPADAITGDYEINEINEVTTTPVQGDPLDSGPRAGFRRVYSGGEAGQGELQEIVRLVEKQGYVLLWSDVLKDFVAFYKTEADRLRIPAGFVPYSGSELQELFREDSPGWSVEGLRHIHMAKKIAGFKVTEVHDDQ